MMQLFSRQRVVRVLCDRHVPRTSGRELGGSHVSQRTARALRIVMPLPQRTQLPGLGLALELLAVQELVAELAVKRLRVTVLLSGSSGKSPDAGDGRDPGPTAWPMSTTPA